MMAGTTQQQAKLNTATRLVELASPPMMVLFHSPDGREYARIPENNHWEVIPLRSREFMSRLSKRYFETYKTTPRGKDLKDALSVLCGKALFDGPELPVNLRVARYAGNLYIDMGDPDWTAAEITPKGWRLINNAPVAFRRPKGMAELPKPVKGGSWQDLFDLLSLWDTDSQTLLFSWLLGAFHPEGPYPVLALYGQQGSGKSFRSRIIRSLIDPNVSSLRACPKDLDDLAVGGWNNYVLALDNVGDIPDWLSDALCRIATGGGIGKRELWTNDEEIILHIKRPVILNAITEVVYRPDLLERTIILEMPAIEEDERKSESELLEQFEQIAPGIMGLIFSALSTILANLPTVKIDRLPRMADFAKWVAAAAPSWGMSSEMIVQIFKDNQKNAEQNLLEENSLWTAVCELINRPMQPSRWEGTATQLLFALKNLPINPYHDAPNARSLSSRLRGLMPVFKRAGYRIKFEDKARPRKIVIEKVQP